MKECLKSFLLYVGVFIVTLLIFIVALYLVWLIPNDKVNQHYEESMHIFEEEGDTWVSFFDYDWSGNLDNLTDKLKIDTVIASDSDNITNKAMYCNSAVRYWHGWVILLRPLMYFYNYGQIRYILLVCHMLGWFAVYNCFSKSDKKSALGWVISLILINCVVLPFSLQFSPVFFISYISILLSERFKDKNATFIGMMFMVIGMCTSYFDFLTAPLITYGLPMIYLINHYISKGINIKDNIISVIKNAIIWALGYGVCWVSKWLFATIVLGENCFKEGIDRVALRSVGENSFIADGREVAISPIRAIGYNIYAIVPKFLGLSADISKANVLYAIMVFVIIFAVMVILAYGYVRSIIKNGKEKLLSQNIINNIPLMIVALSPFAWFTFAQQHSCIHQFFTYRILLVTFLAIWVAVCNIIRETKK